MQNLKELGRILVNLPLITNTIVEMTAGPLSNKQCFDIAFFLEAGKGDKHGFLFDYPERLLGVLRGDKMEWYCARSI